VVLLNEALRLVVFLVVVYILEELKRTLRREAQSARQDPLTRVANRRAFYELAAIEISRSQRSKEPFTIVFADIDNFKVVNDRYGHLAGDHVLNLTAELMKRNVRVVDIVARFGGDEFLLLLTGTDSETARKVVERVKADLAESAKRNGWPISLSTGVFTYTTPPATVDEMITRADQLMYSVKQATKKQSAEQD
jgi:diguanylate cyclase (GGDEF)-like protein